MHWQGPETGPSNPNWSNLFGGQLLDFTQLRIQAQYLVLPLDVATRLLFEGPSLLGAFSSCSHTLLEGSSEHAGMLTKQLCPMPKE